MQWGAAAVVPPSDSVLLVHLHVWARPAVVQSDNCRLDDGSQSGLRRALLP
jgi:hypothetical protein